MKALYDQMWLDSLSRFSTHRFELDPLIDDVNDARRGISVVIRPDRTTLEGLIAVQDVLRQGGAEQYFPVSEALHVTCLTLISCASDFHFDDFPVNDYARVIEECLRTIPCFELVFNGVTASPSCVMAQGFTQAGVLDRIRDALQDGIQKAGLPHTIGHRYPARTAHCTLMRFRQVPPDPDALVHYLKLLRDRPVGRCSVRRVSLVLNDWYHRSSVVRELHSVRLQPVEDS